MIPRRVFTSNIARSSESANCLTCLNLYYLAKEFRFILKQCETNDIIVYYFEMNMEAFGKVTLPNSDTRANLVGYGCKGQGTTYSINKYR